MNIKVKKSKQELIFLVLKTFNMLANEPLSHKDLTVLTEIALFPVKHEALAFSSKTKHLICTKINQNTKYSLNQKTISPILLKALANNFIVKQDDSIIYFHKYIRKAINNINNNLPVNIEFLLDDKLSLH